MSPARSRFTAQRHLATGGMAEVHLAVLRGPHGFEKQAILKQIRPEFARDPEFRRMFIDEARLMASLSHANVVGVLDFGESDAEGLYLALEYVEGLDLDAALTAGGPLETDLALCIVRSVLHALAYVHGLRSKSGEPLRIVHRDVSPSNVLLGINGDVKLGDFGIARMAQRASKTEPGTFKGKAAYASPEQLLGLELDGRSDLFALGIMLFELLTGERPFVAANRALLMRDVIEGPPVDVGGHAPHLSRPLVAVLERVLDRDPERRFQTAEEMAQALDACRAGPPLGPGDVARLVSRLARSRRSLTPSLLPSRRRKTTPRRPLRKTPRHQALRRPSMISRRCL